MYAPFCSITFHHLCLKYGDKHNLSEKYSSEILNEILLHIDNVAE